MQTSPCARFLERSSRGCKPVYNRWRVWLVHADPILREGQEDHDRTYTPERGAAVVSVWNKPRREEEPSGPLNTNTVRPTQYAPPVEAKKEATTLSSMSN